MKRRALVLLVVAVLALVASVGCSETDEEGVANTIRDFYSAYNARDWNACLGHLDDTDNAGASVIQAALQMAREATGEVTVEGVTGIRVSGATATANVRLAYGNKSESKEYPMVKKDGHWKIAWQEAPGGDSSTGSAKG